jgi:tetratricopeptide (TPR) repeat protein
MYQSDTEGGIRDGKEAVEIYEKLVAENPDSLALQTGLLETQIEDAASFVDTNRFAEAVPMLQQTVGKIEELSRKNPDNAEAARILAKCLAYLGHSLSWESRQPEAETAMTRAVEITESLAARFPNDTNFRQDLWRIYQIAAGIYDEVDNRRMFELCEKARKVMEETIALDRANAQARHNLALTLSRLGSASSNLGKADESLKYFEQAAAILSELQAKDPLNRAYDHDASSLQTRIGDAKYKRGDLAGSLEAYEKSCAALETQTERDVAHTRALRNLAMAYRNVGWIHRDYIKINTGQARQNHLEAAKKNYRRSLDALTKLASQNALAEFDKKTVEEVRAALEELEKMR